MYFFKCFGSSQNCRYTYLKFSLFVFQVTTAKMAPRYLPNSPVPVALTTMTQDWGQSRSASPVWGVTTAPQRPLIPTYHVERGSTAEQVPRQQHPCKTRMLTSVQLVTTVQSSPLSPLNAHLEPIPIQRDWWTWQTAHRVPKVHRALVFNSDYSFRVKIYCIVSYLSCVSEDRFLDPAINWYC